MIVSKVAVCSLRNSSSGETLEKFPKNEQTLVPRHKCGALRDLAPFVQFKKRKKHPRRSVNFSQHSSP